jgi:REP element-mobilizing transposase RayT
MEPLYTPLNCTPAYQLHWVLDVFWRTPPPDAGWLASLQRATEPDGVRVLRHRLLGSSTSQFHVSTKPPVAPTALVRSVKGRLQYLVRDREPRAFRRNYGIRSVGSARRETVEDYVRGQTGHHRMADTRVQERLGKYKIEDHDVDLSQMQRGGHCQYWYSLHVVLVHEGRWMEIRDRMLTAMRQMIIRVAKSRAYRLSRGGILPDHVHLTVGCDPGESPEHVALCFMNNLAYACGMKPVFMPSYYVGTIGEYDLGVFRDS